MNIFHIYIFFNLFFIWIAGEHVSRGCIITLDEASKIQCILNDDNCKSCSESGCNYKNDFAKCLLNDNSVSAISENQPSKICSSYDDICFTHVSNGIVRRGCFEEYKKQKNLGEKFLKNNANNALFKTCTTPYCNDDQFNIEQILEAKNEITDETGEQQGKKEDEDKERKDSEIVDNHVDDPVIDGNDVVNVGPQCYECHSVNNEKCKSNLNDGMLVSCSSASRKTEGCYHIITGES